MDADSNSWGSDYAEDYGSDLSDGEYQPNGASSSAVQHIQASSGASRIAVKAKGGVQARKMVNRGRWTKDEVSLSPPPLYSLFLSGLEDLLMTWFLYFRTRSSRESWNELVKYGKLLLLTLRIGRTFSANTAGLRSSIPSWSKGLGPKRYINVNIINVGFFNSPSRTS